MVCVRLAVGLALLCACPAPAPSKPTPTATKTPAKKKPAKANDKAPEKPSAEAPAVPLDGPAKEASPDARKNALMALLADGKTAGELSMRDVDEGATFNPSLATLMARGIAGLPVVRPTKTTVEGDLPKEIVQRVVRSRITEFARCYSGLGMLGAKIGGSIKAKFDLAPGGKVTGDPTLTPEGGAKDCLTQVVKGLRFPKTRDGKPATVEIELAVKAP